MRWSSVPIALAGVCAAVLVQRLDPSAGALETILLILVVGLWSLGSELRDIEDDQ